ncbi:hypothetical protein AXG93_960s1000 [Marchantia polymorpha subsp. ruderalis]|uniref:Rho termination factor-like N-terminal domain-containing protein n=1 Tax=Marchantia polymorpha subsp. ruderalis TaxID=1480154 RepID=A0A176VIC5_MARPO|nr:hypothetical protein AXG93_960s1000 [Marchantia polymorpha subsp. ruderalis]
MAGAARTFHACSIAFNPVKAQIGREECNMKLLRVSELPDGSLHFAFGVAQEGSSSGSIPDANMDAQPMVAGSQPPARLPSAFQKKSPISLSVRRGELPIRTKEDPRMEPEFPKAVPVEEVPSDDLKKNDAHVTDAGEETTSRVSQEAVSSPRQPSRQSQKPLRMKSTFVKQSPVPASIGATHTTLNVSSESSVAKDGTKRTTSEINVQISTLETSESTRGDRAVRNGVEVQVDISTHSENVTPETVREHVADESQTSAKASPNDVLAGSETTSATIARDVEEFAPLNIQGLSVLTGLESLPEQREETGMGFNAEVIENINASKVAELESMEDVEESQTSAKDSPKDDVEGSETTSATIARDVEEVAALIVEGLPVLTGTESLLEQREETGMESKAEFIEDINVSKTGESESMADLEEESQTSAKDSPNDVVEGSETTSATIARDVEKVAALIVEGLPVVTGTESLPEQSEETGMGSKAEIIEDINASEVAESEITADVEEESQTSSEYSPNDVVEGSETTSATIAGDVEEVAALEVEGLPVLMGLESLHEQRGETDMGSKADSIEDINASEVAESEITADVEEESQTSAKDSPNDDVEGSETNSATIARDVEEVAALIVEGLPVVTGTESLPEQSEETGMVSKAEIIEDINASEVAESEITADVEEESQTSSEDSPNDVVEGSETTSAIIAGDVEEDEALEVEGLQVLTGTESLPEQRGETDMGSKADIIESINASEVAESKSMADVEEESQTSAKDSPKDVVEGRETNSATIARDVEEFAVPNIKGLSVLTVSESLPEKRGKTGLGSKADSAENLNAYKLAELKSMAKSRGLRGYSKLKKGDLIELLSKLD